MLDPKYCSQLQLLQDESVWRPQPLELGIADTGLVQVITIRGKIDFIPYQMLLAWN
jgi:hypothetical protein